MDLWALSISLSGLGISTLTNTLFQYTIAVSRQVAAGYMVSVNQGRELHHLLFPWNAPCSYQTSVDVAGLKPQRAPHHP